MSWTKLGAKKAREAMGRETEYDFDPADIARQAANEITGMDVQTSPPPLRPVNVSSEAPEIRAQTQTERTSSCGRRTRGTFSRKGKEKVDGFPTQPPVDTVAEERLMTKLAVKASRLDSFVDPSLPTPTGQTSGRGSNQMSAADFTAQVNQISGNLPCEGQMTQSMSNMASTLSMAMEEHSHIQLEH
ncbi:hypothetical protein R1sor_001092 [Riccia sorocarpa]|uniref:Uncharacterized protein n=1 Tax=Riccia sorocarpa TaxID=122646 RepID=A0ABD3GUZ1_9MARC